LKLNIDKAIENHLKGIYEISDSVDEKVRERVIAALDSLKNINKKQVWAGQCAPEGTKGNYQTIFPISDPPDNKRLGIPSPRYQIDCFSLNFSDAKRMADLTYDALEGFYGQMGGTGGIMVECGIYQDTGYEYENETKRHHFWVDVVIQYYS
jgi:hypothetical protein